MGSKLKRWLGTLLLACVSGALYFFGTGLHPHWYLAWLAPIPVLLAAPRISRHAAALAAFAAFALGELNMFTYARAIIPLPVLLLLVIAPAALLRRVRPGISHVCPARAIASRCAQLACALGGL